MAEVKMLKHPDPEAEKLLVVYVWKNSLCDAAKKIIEEKGLI